MRRHGLTENRHSQESVQNAHFHIILRLYKEIRTEISVVMVNTMQYVTRIMNVSIKTAKITNAIVLKPKKNVIATALVSFKNIFI